ncbi:MAG: CcmD family protein [bacterium]
MLRLVLPALVVVTASAAAPAAPAPGPEARVMETMRPPPAGGAMGQTTGPKADPQGGRKGWKPYDYSKRQRGESIPSGTLVIIAYILIWAVVLAYVVILARRQSKLREELAELRRRLESADDGTGAG